MSAVDFGVLKLIPEMLKEMQELKDEVIELRQHIKPKYDLTKRAGVMKYLNISDSTITTKVFKKYILKKQKKPFIAPLHNFLFF